MQNALTLFLLTSRAACQVVAEGKYATVVNGARLPGWENLQLKEVQVSRSISEKLYGTSVQPSSSSTASQSPVSTLTNKEQVGKSLWGNLNRGTFPKWLSGLNGQPYSAAPWGDRTTENSDATIKDNVPETNVTRSYDFTISRSQISPDGVLRDVLLINGMYPGPIIEANWGDWIEVKVTNNITEPDEGTALHWHGMLQRGSQWEDGTPGVSQCPIAPGTSYTYKFQAEIYGTSMYHAHYSAQYTAGLIGPMQIYGPWDVDYDVDLGPVMLTDCKYLDPTLRLESDFIY